ncbi:MAG: hypothetical protein IKO32_00995 [Lachnospiraceae bacterium]|nr:hypothetical protein [Lachnospiraceae bacterium]
MKKIPAIFSAALILCMIPCLFGCAYTEAKKEARAFKNNHEQDFVQAVENELGSDYKLSDVQGEIESYGELFPEGYNVRTFLTGTVKHDGKNYNAAYDVNTFTLTTDAFAGEIEESLIESLGLDPSKVQCLIGDETRDHLYEYPASAHTIEEALNSPRKIRYYIVTSEDLENIDYSKYASACKKTGNLYEVHILASDDFTNMKVFKKRYWDITITEDRYPSMYYNGSDTGIFGVYNLKEFVYIDKTAKGEIHATRYTKNEKKVTEL